MDGTKEEATKLNSEDDIDRPADEQPDLSTRQKWMRTAIIYAIYFGTGMFLAIYGPTLPVLQDQTGVDTKRGALLFTFGGIGRIIAAFLQTVLYGTLATWFQLVVVLLLMPTAAIALPQIHNYAAMSVVCGLQGFAAGSIGSITNSYVFEIWKLQAGPAIQGLHFIISVGSTCVTLIVKFFLPTNLANNDDHANLTINSTSVESDTTGYQDIFYPYLVVAIFNITVWLFVLAYFAESGFAVLRKMNNGQNSQKRTKTKKVADLRMVILFGIMMFCFGGNELSFSGLLLTFVTEEVEWSTENGAYLTFTYWVGLSFGRGMSTFTARCVKPRTTIAISLATLCSAFLAMSIFYRHHPVVLWICTCVVGASMAPLVASTLSHANAYIGTIGWVTSFHLGCLYTGFITVPPFTAFLFKTIESTWFLYIGLSIANVCVALLIVIEIIHKRSKSIPHGLTEAEI